MKPTFLRFEWVDVAPSPDTLSQHTMAQLTIRVGDSSATSVLDLRSRSVRDYVLVPLLDVAEWVVANWWHLWHELEDVGSHPQRPGFESRHDLAFAGNGFVLPKLTIVPVGNQVHLRWSRWKPSHAPIEFFSEHSEYVERAELEAAIRSLVDAVLERLRDRGLGAEALEREWNAINSLRNDEREFCQAAALLGLDPFAVSDTLADSIVALWNRLDPSLREETFGSSTSDALGLVGKWIDESLASLADVRSGAGWQEIRHSITRPGATEAWERGYELAQLVREWMNLGNRPFEFETSGKWALYYREAQLPTDRILGLVGVIDPSCIIDHRSEAGTRFLLARALGDYLGRPEAGAGMLTSLLTPRQAQSRSFAAEFLAPAVSLRERLGPHAPLVDAENIDELAREFHVSSYVIRHQIQNHGLGVIVEPDGLHLAP